MSVHRFSSGARFRWHDQTYEVRRLLPDQQVNIEDIFSGAVLVIELSVLVHALFAGELHFVRTAGPPSPDSNSLGAASGYLDLADCPAELVAIARYRLAVIQPLLELTSRTREAVAARAREVSTAPVEIGQHALHRAVSPASIYRWITDYTGSGHDVRALIPSTHQRGGKDESRLAPAIETLLQAVIQDRYYVREKVTLDDIRDELAVRLAEENRLRPPREQLVLPSASTITRRTRSLRPRQRHGATQYGQTEYPTRPLERVEIDHTKSDLIVIDDQDNLPLGRLTLTYCLDLATRYPLGYYLGFEPPSYLAVMECLYHAIRPKENLRERYGTAHDWIAYGVPAALVVDNGREFIGRDLPDACLLLGIVLQQTPVQTPQFKAGIERLFGSLNTMFFHTLPGTTFANIRERGDYDSIKQACVYLSEVDQMLNIFMVDVYAEQFHRGLGGIPARRWEALIQHGLAPALPPNAAELAILLGRTTERVIQHYGIEFASLRYNCDELAPLRTQLQGAPAKIKYHPADLSCVHAYDPCAQRYIPVPALDQDYTHGLSLWKHRVIRRAVLDEQRTVDPVALGRAKRQIQALVDAGRQRKRQSTRSRIARWETAGKPIHQVGAAAPGAALIQEPAGTVITAATLPTPIGSAQLPAPGTPPDPDWEISYALPQSRSDLITTDTGGECDG